jgi:electron transport complex protein RnfG
MKDIVKMAVALALFAVAACVALAFVYDATSKTIAERQEAGVQASLRELFPAADSFDDISGSIASGNAQVSFGAEYVAKKDGAVLGAVVSASGAGFNDTLGALVGIGADGTIAGVRIIVNTDTPGLGANASSPAYFVDKPAKTKTFYGQFAGMSVTGSIKVQKDGGEVVAITAATITSRAAALLAETAAEAAAAWLNGGAK